MADPVNVELGAVQQRLFIPLAEGVLVCLAQAPQVIARAPQVIARIAGRFPGALIAVDTYSQRMLEQQHKMAARKGMDARWAWSCDDPRTLGSAGLEVVQEAAVTRPPPRCAAGCRVRTGTRCRWPDRSWATWPPSRCCGPALSRAPDSRLITAVMPVGGHHYSPQGPAAGRAMVFNGRGWSRSSCTCHSACEI